MATSRPIFVIIAGGNGVGKSTFANVFGIIGAGFPYLNPDRIQRLYGLTDSEAARKMISFVDQILDGCSGNLAIETTLAGKRPLQLIEKARQLGWEVQLVYLGVANVDIQIERVERRVEQGGHPIPEATIRRRYERSLESLQFVLRLCDKVAIYDNSQQEARPLCFIEQGHLVWEIGSIPDWLEPTLETIRGI